MYLQLPSWPFEKAPLHFIAINAINEAALLLWRRVGLLLRALESFCSLTQSVLHAHSSKPMISITARPSLAHLARRCLMSDDGGPLGLSKRQPYR